MIARLCLGILLAAAVAACDDSDYRGPLGPNEGDPPQLDAPGFTWVQDGWDGVEPLGHAAVLLSWGLPADFNGETFRVYSKRSGNAGYSLIATVTSCTQGFCTYTDANVTPGQSYDYYIASVDERRDRELAASREESITVPSFDTPETPEIDRAVGLDGAVYLTWQSTGASYYRVFLESVDDDDVFYEIGSSDGTGYLDERAENGTRYRYSIAAVDSFGYVSARGDLATGIPRPDYHADLLYPLDESADSSGFRFVTSDDQSPTLPGTAPNAEWRIEKVAGVLSIVPVGDGVSVTQGELTTALTCGPGAEPDCVSLDRVTDGMVFGVAPVAVQAGHAYVFRLGGGANAHYAKVRIIGSYEKSSGRTAVVFDWAYQLVAGEPSLSRS